MVAVKHRGLVEERTEYRLVGIVIHDRDAERINESDSFSHRESALAWAREFVSKLDERFATAGRYVLSIRLDCTESVMGKGKTIDKPIADFRARNGLRLWMMRL